MTGDDIIELAREDFGERTALTISVSEAKHYLNRAMAELYEDLPPDRMRNLLVETVVALAAGQGDLDSSWDKILAVYVDNKPAVEVPKESIQAWDFNSYMRSEIPVFCIDHKHIWVRPTTSAAKVVRATPPTPITDFTQPVTAFQVQFHRLIAFLMASYMYAKEEDLTQAAHYRNQYKESLHIELAQSVTESE